MFTLKALRVNKGYTQPEAAELIGVGEKAYCSWEQGKTFPNAIQIKKIEKVFDTTYDQINFLPNSIG